MINEKVMKILKKRRRILRSAVNANSGILKGLANKSRHVRRLSMAGPRKNMFTDRLLELENLIDFLESRMTEKEYYDRQVNERIV